MASTATHPSDATGGAVPLLEMRAIRKSFGPVTVLSDINLTCRAGTITAICGENGAGKSTLMKILSGIHAPDSGEILIEGEKVSFAHPAEALRAGIAIIHQELNLLPHRSVADNIFLAREISRFGLLDRKSMNARAAAVLQRLGCAIDPRVECGTLSIAEMQLVEIAKAISEEARILILDEPTAALDEAETRALFNLLGELKRSGVGIFYISHRMAEIKQLADRIAVIKDGALVASLEAGQATVQDIVRHMVGRELKDFYPPAGAKPPGETLYSVKSGGNDDLSDINLDLRAGEIVGVAGLEGSGKTELARAMVGLNPFTRGATRLSDGGGAPTSPREAAGRGVGFVPDDRKRDGLGLQQSQRDNAGLTMRALGRFFASATRAERSVRRIDALLDAIQVRSADYDMPVGSLSGGNQQKVLFARLTAIRPRVWIVAEPTRGIDVGAKATIYKVLRSLSDEGGAVLVVSSDLMELIGLCDRICVMAAGRLVADLPRGASEEEIIHHAVRQDFATHSLEARP